jgi:hypothetical protein
MRQRATTIAIIIFIIREITIKRKMKERSKEIWLKRKQSNIAILSVFFSKLL